MQTTARVPTYICSLHSVSQDLLVTTRPQTVASRAFRHSAANIWDSIPFNIHNVTILLPINVDWRLSPSKKPLPSRNCSSVPTNSTVLNMACYKGYFTYLLTYCVTGCISCKSL